MSSRPGRDTRAVSRSQQGRGGAQTGRTNSAGLYVMTEQELLIDCLKRLNRAEIAYMVTGSMASNFWGIPRSTHDLDFAIQLPAAVISKIIDEFSSDFLIDEYAIRAAYRPPFQFNAIHRLSSLKVDFWLPANIPFEREMFRRRAQKPIFGVPAWIATP